MKGSEIQQLGVPSHLIPLVIEGIRALELSGRDRITNHIKLAVAQDPGTHPAFRPLAEALQQEASIQLRETPAPYRTWGDEGIDPQSHVQMQQALSLPCAVQGALMPDAHVGYGLPIGGVLALDNAVCPFGVGVDIACRMKLSVLDLRVSRLRTHHDKMVEALNSETRFGMGSSFSQDRNQHDVLDHEYWADPYMYRLKDYAWDQLGSSGGGNHFVEFGIVKFFTQSLDGVKSTQEYIGILSHSGSRGTGAKVADHYSKLAEIRIPPKLKAQVGKLAWLDLDSHDGHQYWQAMNLMGEYAKANHAVIHHRLARALGAEVIWDVENHHNFAWKEVHNGREVVVHRKGATPAGSGVLGVIPGTMAEPAYIVKGRGNPESLNSASHGAGRLMSRKQANQQYCWKDVQRDLKAQGITVLAAGADEVPGAYKRIDQVMAAQSDLVEVLGTFCPKIVRMAGSVADDGD